MSTIVVLECGKFYYEARSIRFFKTLQKAIANIPEGFEKINEASTYMQLYYENRSDEKWLTIRICEIED